MTQTPMATPGTRQKALETAHRCGEMGASSTTIATITGLPRSYIRAKAYSRTHPAPKGRPRHCEEFFFRANTLAQAEASLFGAQYRRLCADQAQLLPADAVVAAFERLRRILPTATLSFDEAFFLGAKLGGLWGKRRTMDIRQCDRCGCEHLVTLGEHNAARAGCPVCRTDWALAFATARQCRARTAPAAVTQRDAAPAPIEADILLVKLRSILDELGASPKVAGVLADDPRAALFRPSRGRRTVTSAHLPKPLCLDARSAQLSVGEQIQYSVFASGYRRTQRLGLTRPLALGHSTTRMREACRHLGRPVAFDRCFEVAALLDAVWGVEEAQLDLSTCSQCGAEFLRSRQEAGPAACPFCLVLATARADHGEAPRQPQSPAQRAAAA